MNRRYEIRMETDDERAPGQLLLVIRDGKVIRSESDHGEPEDNLFYRDWAWVKPALEEAYRLGVEDGRSGEETFQPKGPSFVVGLLKRKDGCVLAVSRRNRPHDLGLPGGTIEARDFNPFVALIREVKEETDVDVTSACYAFSRVDETTDGKVAWTFLVEGWSGEPKQVEDGVTVQWVRPGRLLEEGCTFREYNRALFEHLGILEDEEERESTNAYYKEEGRLYNADPNCDHDIEEQWSGVKCRKCPGWYCA